MRLVDLPLEVSHESSPGTSDQLGDGWLADCDHSLVLSRLRCLLIDHRWVRMPYPDGDTADAFYLRCKRCGRNRDMRSRGVDGAMGAGMGPWHA